MPATRFTTAPTAPLPLDVRAMQTSANALFALVVVALVLAAFAWLVRLPVFTIHGVKVEGDLSRNSVATIRANAMPGLAGSFFTMDLQRARAAFESVPGCAVPSSRASGPTACRCAWKSTARPRCGPARMATTGS